MVGKEDVGKIALFESLEDSERENLGSRMEVRSFYKGDVIFPEEKAGGVFYIIKDGEIKISQVIREGERQVLSTLGAGEHFGSISLIDGHEHSASAEAVSDCTVFELKKEDFDGFAEEFPGAGLKVLTKIVVSLCSFVREIDKKFVDMVQYITLDR